MMLEVDMSKREISRVFKHDPGGGFIYFSTFLREDSHFEDSNGLVKKTPTSVVIPRVTWSVGISIDSISWFDLDTWEISLSFCDFYMICFIVL